MNIYETLATSERTYEQVKLCKFPLVLGVCSPDGSNFPVSSNAEFRLILRHVCKRGPLPTGAPSPFSIIIVLNESGHGWEDRLESPFGPEEKNINNKTRYKSRGENRRSYGATFSDMKTTILAKDYVSLGFLTWRGSILSYIWSQNGVHFWVRFGHL